MALAVLRSPVSGLHLGIVAPHMDIVDRHLITAARDASLLPEPALPPPPQLAWDLPLLLPPRPALRRRRLRLLVQMALAGQRSRVRDLRLGIAVPHMGFVDRHRTIVGRDASLLLEPALPAPQLVPLLRRPRNQLLVLLRPLLQRRAQRRPRLRLLVRMVLAGQQLHVRDLRLEIAALSMVGADRRLIIAGRDASLLLEPALLALQLLHLPRKLALALQRLLLRQRVPPRLRLWLSARMVLAGRNTHAKGLSMGIAAPRMGGVARQRPTVGRGVIHWRERVVNQTRLSRIRERSLSAPEPVVPPLMNWGDFQA